MNETNQIWSLHINIIANYSYCNNLIGNMLLPGAQASVLYILLSAITMVTMLCICYASSQWLPTQAIVITKCYSISC